MISNTKDLNTNQLISESIKNLKHFSPSEVAVIMEVSKHAKRVSNERAYDYGGYCAYASHLIADRIGGHVVFGHFRGSQSPHVWVEKNGFIIDATVDQFHNGYEDIPYALIVRRNSPYAKSHYFHKPNNLGSPSEWRSSWNKLDSRRGLLRRFRFNV